jgi:hypothetical protein
VDGDLAVDEVLARKLLGIADWPDGMVDRLFAISYNTLTRIDTRNAFALDLIDRERVVAAMRDDGYDADTAELLAKLADEDALKTKQAEAQRYNPFTPRGIMAAVASGEMTEDEAIDQLQRLKVKNDDVQPMIDAAKLEARVAARKKCVAGVRHRFMLGDIDVDFAVQQLLTYDVGREIADTIAGRWECERVSRGKEVSAAKNAAFYQRGIISLDDYARRLINLGYQPEDADDFLREALDIKQEKIRKENEKLAKQAAAAAKAAEKAAEKARHDRAMEEAARQCGKPPKKKKT